MRIINLDTVGSTNTYLARLRDREELPGFTLVTARAQEAGRGQRGNSWEAEPGMNVTMSLLIRQVAFEPRDQFAISEIVSLAIAETLETMLPGHAVAIKWPNDIYVDGKKICGILIEHSLMAGRIDSTIIGIGLNVNQREFRSDAPNPVSLIQLTGREYSVEQITSWLSSRIICLYNGFKAPARRGALHASYISRLWRRGIEAPYTVPATGERFTGILADVDPDGRLRIDTPAGPRHFLFKEIAFEL